MEKVPPDQPGPIDAKSLSRGHRDSGAHPRGPSRWKTLSLTAALLLIASTALAADRPCNPRQGCTGCPGRVTKAELTNYENKAGTLCQVVDSNDEGDCDPDSPTGTVTSLCSWTGAVWESLGGGGGGGSADVLTQPCEAPVGGGVAAAGEMNVFCDADGVAYISTSGSTPQPIALSEEGFVHSLPGIIPGCIPAFASSAGNSMNPSGLCVSGGVATFPGIFQADEIRASSRASTNDNFIELEKNVGNPTCADKCTAGKACILFNQSTIRICDGATARVTWP